jgi:hypothetical protein
MTTFLDLKNLVFKSLGHIEGDDDVLTAMVPAAINYAQLAVALIFKPPELFAENNLTISSGSPKVSLGSLDFIDVIKVRNVTDSRDLHYIPFENWEILVPTLTVVKFYSMFGEWLYVKKTPTVDTVITIYQLTYPTELTANGQELDFPHYDGNIVAAACAICFAAIEEGESVDVWGKVTEALGMPALKGSQMREVIAGR